MATSKAQIKAQAKYDKANTVQITLKLNKKTDKDIIDWLYDEGNKQGYIKSLIRDDIEKYDKANTVQITLKLNKKTDKDIIDWLYDEGNKQGYIKSLIRDDIERTP